MSQDGSDDSGGRKHRFMPDHKWDHWWHHHHHHHDDRAPLLPTGQPREEDSLYKLIDAPEREDRKLFGMAKTFPQVTRSGWRNFLHDKAKKGEVNEEQLKQEPLVRSTDFSLVFQLKKRFHAEFSEFLGVFIFYLLGYCATLQKTIGGEAYTSPSFTVLAWGFANMIGIYVAGGYSGAHLNPVLTMNLWFFRGFPLQRVFQFWIAQFLGTLAAVAWAFILYYPALLRYNGPGGWDLSLGGSFFTTPQEGMPIMSAWFNEVTATMVMHIAIFAVGDSHNISPVRGMNALVLGLTVFTIGNSIGYLTPWGMNPFRDFAPRVFLSMVGFPKQLWTEHSLWWLVGGVSAPALGSFLGCLAYDTFVFDGPESPVNFSNDIKIRAIRSCFRRIFHPYRTNDQFDVPTPDEDQSFHISDNNDNERTDRFHGNIQSEGQPAG